MGTYVRNGLISSNYSGIISLFHFICTPLTTVLFDQCITNNSTRNIIQEFIRKILLDYGLYEPLWDMTFGAYSKWYNHKEQIQIPVAHF